MRNNPRNPVIAHLIERSESKRNTRIDNYLINIKKREAESKKMEEFRVKQIQLENDGGEWVEIRKGIRIFIREGEDKDAKVAKFRQKLKIDNNIGKTLTEKYWAKSFD